MKRSEADERSKSFLSLLYDVGVFEMVFELSCALDSCVADLAYFYRVEFVPFPLMEFFIKVNDELCVDEIQKSIPHVAVVLNRRIGTL